MPPTTDESLQKINEKISQLQARKKSIENKERQKAKRARTRRLIRYGELIEKYLDFETPEQLEDFLKNNKS